MTQKLATLIRDDRETFHVKPSGETPDEPAFKRCVVCKKARHPSLFRTRLGSKRKYVHRCQLCRTTKLRARKMKLPTTGKSRYEQASDKLTLPGFLHRRIERLWRAAQLRAWRNGIEFDLSKAWIAERLIAAKCEVTGLPFTIEGVGKNLFSPSVDRTDPNLGYVPSNCKMVVWCYNMAKGVGTHELVVRMARALVEAEDAKAKSNVIPLRPCS